MTCVIPHWRSGFEGLPPHAKKQGRDIFGLADECKDWCVKRRRISLLRVSDYIETSIYSGKGVFGRAEMKTHRCVRR